MTEKCCERDRKHFYFFSTILLCFKVVCFNVHVHVTVHCFTIIVGEHLYILYPASKFSMFDRRSKPRENARASHKACCSRESLLAGSVFIYMYVYLVSFYCFVFDRFTLMVSVTSDLTSV